LAFNSIYWIQRRLILLDELVTVGKLPKSDVPTRTTHNNQNYQTNLKQPTPKNTKTHKKHTETIPYWDRESYKPYG